MSNLIDCNLDDLKSQIKNIEQDTKTLKDKKKYLLSILDGKNNSLSQSNDKKKCIIYGIRASPSKDNHAEHIIGYCSTLESAMKVIGSGSSYDDGVWRYYDVFIHILYSEEEKKTYELDKLPDYFPY